MPDVRSGWEEALPPGLPLKGEGCLCGRVDRSVRYGPSDDVRKVKLQAILSQRRKVFWLPCAMFTPASWWLAGGWVVFEGDARFIHLSGGFRHAMKPDVLQSKIMGGSDNKRFVVDFLSIYV